MDTVDTIQKDNCTIEISQDDDPIDPREWDNLGEMICWHNRYTLGDKNDFSTPDDFYEWLKDNPAIVLPLYLYDHSGLSISTSNAHYPFNDRWDSGQIGYIYVTYETIRKEYNWKLITKSRKEKITQYLKNEVTTYNDYLTGNVYGYEVFCDICDPDHEDSIDSCWGFYGYEWDKNGLLDQANTHCKNCEDMKELQLEKDEYDWLKLFVWGNGE